MRIKQRDVHLLGAYLEALEAYRACSKHAWALSDPDDIRASNEQAIADEPNFKGSDCRVAVVRCPDGNAIGGYVVLKGYLMGLFADKGLSGTALLQMAVQDGARKLDCFDGFLPDWYKQRGWVETSREANWDPNGPDVVFMQYLG
mgnify:CR=1 FL=1